MIDFFATLFPVFTANLRLLRKKRPTRTYDLQHCVNPLLVLMNPSVSFAALLSVCSACTFAVPSLHPGSVHCSALRCPASWLMVNFGLGAGGERGGVGGRSWRREQRQQQRRHGDISPPLFICALFPLRRLSVCAGSAECGAEGC